MIKRIEKKYKNIEHENEMSDYLENFEILNQKGRTRGGRGISKAQRKRKLFL